MLYKTFKDLKLSALGFGNMRLPVLVEDNSQFGGPVDASKAGKMNEYAYENGVNYFDTAYGYHSGDSELFTGRTLSRFPRNTWHVATKFPGYDLRLINDPPKTFNEQLRKLRVDYVDFYLMHNVSETNIDPYTDKGRGIVDYLLGQKKAGRIRHFGFSAHGRIDTIKRFLDFCGSEMEFAQIQLNSLDWFLQDAKGKYDLLTARGIPVWVMEPVRGGRLSSFGADNDAKLKALRPNESVSAWAFRWLETLPALGVVLSGMTTMEQVVDNIETFKAPDPLKPNEKELYESIVGELVDMIPCTACRYCCPECPKDIDIPTMLTLYNEARFVPGFVVLRAMSAIDPERHPSACVECGQCKDVCPQKIDVPECLKHFREILDKTPPMNL